MIETALIPGYSVNVLDVTILPAGFLLVIVEEVESIQIVESVLLPFGIMERSVTVQRVKVSMEIVSLF